MADKIESIALEAKNLFEKRGSLLSLWQEIADNFYPERADFTTSRSLGTDFASNLTTSFPVMARRDLGDMFSSMLRPQDIQWFSVTTNKMEKVDHAGRVWLEQAGKTQRNAMYDRVARFQRATKEGDHDYSAFGQCVISKEINHSKQALLYRTWHLRDMAWSETFDGEALPIFRRWRPTVSQLMAEMKGKVSKDVKDMFSDPAKRHEHVECMHAVVAADNYESEKKWRTPYVSIFYEVATKFVNREEGVWTKIYTIPRWQTVSGSQYAYSPCTVAALPDARLIQQMTLVLLEAGEKAVNPPLIATQEVVRSDVLQMAGGITWVDAEYDERLGEALRPMSLNNNGIPHGTQMREETKHMIEQAFYLDKIGLPEMNGDMTAFETAQRVKEYIRKIVPLFSPIEAEYNGELCEDTFELLMRQGAFGPADEIPDSLRGQDIKFQFRSPLSENLDRQKVQSFAEAKQMLAESVALDPGSPRIMDIRKALRDTLYGAGVPSDWFRPEEEVAAMDEADAKKQQQQEMIATMSQGGEAALKMGQAANQFQQAGTGGMM